MKNVKFLVHIISEQPLKAISLMFKTETVGPGFILILKGGHGTPGPPDPPALPGGYVLCRAKIYISIRAFLKPISKSFYLDFRT